MVFIDAVLGFSYLLACLCFPAFLAVSLLGAWAFTRLLLRFTPLSSMLRRGGSVRYWALLINALVTFFLFYFLLARMGAVSVGYTDTAAPEPNVAAELTARYFILEPFRPACVLGYPPVCTGADGFSQRAHPTLLVQTTMGVFAGVMAYMATYTALQENDRKRKRKRNEHISYGDYAVPHLESLPDLDLYPDLDILNE